LLTEIARVISARKQNENRLTSWGDPAFRAMHADKLRFDDTLAHVPAWLEQKAGGRVTATCH
jgi:hypothetical protein